MRKRTYLAITVLTGAIIAATPIQALAEGPQRAKTAKSNIKVVTVGNRNCPDLGSLKDYLADCQFGNMQIITIPCWPNQQKPGVGDNNQPGKPEVEDNNQTGKPEVEDNNQSNKPGMEDNNQSGKPEVEDNNQPNKPEVEEDNQTGQPEADNSTQSVHAYVKRIVELVNQERAKEGLNALTLNMNVTKAAQVRAVECQTLFSHTRPNGTSFATALKEAGVSYRGAGENIAWGQKTPEQVMQGWMNSAGHRANILNARYTSIGVGYYRNASGVNYWTQLFTY